MPKGHPIPLDVKERIVPMYKSGLSQQEVADQLGISQNVVSRYVRKSGYDRYHVGGAMARTTPVPVIDQTEQSHEKPKKPIMRTIARSLKLKSDVTGLTYTVSTESDLIDIEGDTALLQLDFNQLKSFMQELESIAELLGSPS